MPVQLVITMDDNGQCNISGPIENKLLCYGLLELAKEAVHKHNEKTEQRIVQPVVNFPSAKIANG